MARPKLSTIPTETLIKELERRQAKADQLRAERDRLDKEIAQLAPAATSVAKAKPAAPARRKTRRKARTARGGAKPLGQYMREVLAGKAKGMSLPQIEKAVRAAGYPTAAKSIYNPMLKVIRKDKSFKKLSRGVYGLKAKPGRKPGKAAKSAKPAKAKKPAAPKAKKTVKRKKYAVTAEQFVLEQVKGNGAATGDINKAWAKAGRTGRADNTLNKMLKAGKLKRKNIEGQRGSIYTAA